jgi:hypothetical protein
MSRITAVLLFLEILRRTTAIAVSKEEIREIYFREFITHPDGGPICSFSTDGYNSSELLLGRFDRPTPEVPGSAGLGVRKPASEGRRQKRRSD